MALILKNRTDVEDLTIGCTFFGTGGGGTMQVGLEMLYPHVDAGRKLEIIEIDKLKSVGKTHISQIYHKEFLDGLLKSYYRRAT